MSRPETSTVFAGVDGRTTSDLPEWYAARRPDAEATTFAEAVRELPRAALTEVAYWNPMTNTWIETDRFNAVVEPSRLADTAADGGETAVDVSDAGDDVPDPLFNVPTDSYAVINPVDVYGPLEDVLRETEYDGHTLGEIAFGEIRQYRGGGEVHMDILFDGHSVDLPGRTDPITMGVSSGYDFFGGHAVYVEGFAQDTHCANSMRGLTDRQTIRHVGEVSDFASWWEQILAQLELVTNDLYGFITDAQEITVDFTTVPFDHAEFYSLLGFPDYLADRAAGDARAEADDPFDVDMWTLHSGATYALTHFFSGKEGTSLDTYVRIANDILFNPEGTLAEIERAVAERAESETGDGQSELESQIAIAQVERVSADVRDRAETFEEREAALRERFAALDQ